MGFIAGQYTMTVGSGSPVSAGQLQEGVKISHTFFKQLITGDNMAQSPQNGVFQGGEVGVEYRLMEYNAAAAATLFWPYGSAYLTMDGVIGALDDSFADQLILSALSGTPAASTPASITMPYCILSEGYPVEILFAPEHRTIPIKQRVYPSSNKVFGTLT